MATTAIRNAHISLRTNVLEHCTNVLEHHRFVAALDGLRPLVSCWLPVALGGLKPLVACLLTVALACMLPKTAVAVDDQNSADHAPHATPDMLADYFEGGSNGGRGGLPSVNLWFKKSQQKLIRSGAPGWNYPAESKPKAMHYAGWSFWHFGIADACLQIISEQATDPDGKPAELGPYFSTFTNSGLTSWSKSPPPRKGLEVDISADYPVTESCRSDHYVIYGLTPQLFFNGRARFLIAIDKDRHITASLLSSTLPEAATANLKRALMDLDGHPVLSFPDDSAGQEKIQLIADFVIDRKPGKLRTSVFR